MGPTGVETETSLHRLPTKVLPVNYSLHIDPNWATSEFTCIESIEVDVKFATNQVILNAVDLKIVQMTYQDEFEVEISDTYQPTHVFCKEKETLIISFKKSLRPGKGKLIIIFTGIINEEWKGFYRFKDVRSTKTLAKYRYTLATHFECSYARRVFPCWDEPGFKATFEISLVVPISLIALSNMPKITESLGSPGMKIVKFSRTPVMSTYLVAFVIGEFEYLKTECAGVECQVYTAVGKKEKAEFVQQVVSKLIPFYNNFFGHPYPLPKLDIVTLKEFASVGAMENWGLIIINESKILTEETVSSSRTKQTIAQTIAHELSHQWFGNLVTIEWWNDMWLKEGVAHFLEFLALEQVFPQYDSRSQFTTSTMIKALELDAVEGSHPIAVPVDDATQVSQTFDRLAYIKGSALIQMLHNYITDPIFRKALCLYFTRYKYKNATAEDLWGVLEEVSFKPIKAMMVTWTNQKGFPLLKICFDQPEDNSRTFTVTQEKFCAQSKFRSKEELDCCRWILPITFSSAQKPRETSFRLLMNGVQARLINFTITNLEKNDWVKINSGLQGFYRVHYPADTLAEFVPAILNRTMDPLDRLGLLDDLYSIVKTGDVGTVELMRFMRSYMKEDDFNVWLAIDNIVGALNILLSFTDLHHKFQNYAKREIFKDIEEKIGWFRKVNEEHTTALLRVHILSRMVSLGSEKTIRHAKERFKHRHEVPIAVDLRSVVYRAVLKSGSGSSEALESLLTMYNDSNLQEEKLRILRALGSVNTPILRQKVLDFAMSDKVKPDDVLNVIIGMCISKPGIECVWNYFKENFQVFKERFPIGQLFIRFIQILTWSFTTEEMAVEVEKFLTENEFEGIIPTIQQVVENIRVNEAWIKRDIGSLRTFLTKV